MFQPSHLHKNSVKTICFVTILKEQLSYPFVVFAVRGLHKTPPGTPFGERSGHFEAPKALPEIWAPLLWAPWPPWTPFYFAPIDNFREKDACKPVSEK